MKFLFAAVLIFAGASSVVAHPGKTDRWGGHKCWKECGSWELQVGEYHLHDRDFNPVRVRPESRRKESPPVPAEIAGYGDKGKDLETPAPNAAEVKPKPRTVVVERYDYVRVVDQEIFPFSSLLLALTAVLLLLLLLLLRIKKSKT